MEAKGAVTGTFSGTQRQEGTGLQGLCNPDTFANFMLATPGGKDYDGVRLTNMSKRAVGAGETGEFRLDYVEVTFRKTFGDSFSATSASDNGDDQPHGAAPR